MSVLELNHVKKSFNNGTLHVLKDISLSVEKGEVVAIIGPSGSGKSTLLRCATLLERIDSGEVCFDGHYAARTGDDGAAVYADKIAVDEETVRLRSHLNQLDQMLTTGGPIGRKLDFLLQEFNRESNTIGSKGNDLEQARTVVDLKAELEKIREQTQNIE